MVAVVIVAAEATAEAVPAVADSISEQNDKTKFIKYEEDSNHHPYGTCGSKQLCTDRLQRTYAQ